MKATATAKRRFTREGWISGDLYSVLLSDRQDQRGTPYVHGSAWIVSDPTDHIGRAPDRQFRLGREYPTLSSIEAMGDEWLRERVRLFALDNLEEEPRLEPVLP